MARVLIVGAGPAGASLAHLLAHRGVDPGRGRSERLRCAGVQAHAVRRLEDDTQHGAYAAVRPRQAGEVVLEVDVVVEKMPWVEPQLPKELGDLPEQQRIAFTLIHGYEWTFSEVAELMGVARATVQTHEARAMATLRKRLGVTDDH